MAYALDSTTIDLCLQMFPWAKFNQNKGAVKMHTLLDLQGSIPTFIKITPGSAHDLNILDQMPIEAGAFTKWTWVTWIIIACIAFSNPVDFS
jgi:hypothetical protein